MKLRQLFSFVGRRESEPASDAPPMEPERVSLTKRRTAARRPLTPFQKIALDHESTAVNGGAIAAKWIWRGGTTGCYRPEHQARDAAVYIIRGNWALEKGLIGYGDGFTDETTKPLEEEGCRCGFHYFYNLRDLPEDYLTAKGKKTLAKVRV